MHSVTFDVSPEVEPGKPLPLLDAEPLLAAAFRGKLEGMWTPRGGLVVCCEEHQLLAAIHDAFYRHYPLQLSPDVLWLTLARGFALHVNLHAEEFRDRFVSRSGQEKISIVRRDFLPGRANPWGEVFEQFSDKIEERVGKLRRFLRCDFSTTGPVERAASDVIVMETFKSYFEYEAVFGCGIPSITLTGTPDDWRSIRQRVALFGEFGLEAWSRALDPVLAQLVAAAEGKADRDFWRSMFRYHSGSGPAVMTGWVNTLFPYHEDREGRLTPNPFLEDWEARLRIDEEQHFRERWGAPQGVGMQVVPACVTSVPLEVFWGSRPQPMRLVGGLLGVSQDPRTLALIPEAGWAVVHETPAGQDPPPSPGRLRRGR